VAALDRVDIGCRDARSSAGSVPTARPSRSWAPVLGDMSAPYRAVVSDALAELPMEVSEALVEAGYQIRVVESDGPPPFGFTPYPVDALQDADPAQTAGTGRKRELNGAALIAERSDPYFTFADLARQRGAESREEVAEMARIAARLNPDLALPNGDLPPGRTMLIPDYYYWRGQRVPTSAWLAITQEAQGIAGTTFDHRIDHTDAPEKLILMSASAFRDPLVHFYVHHEIGHAVADILATRDPAFSRQLHDRMAIRMEADRAGKTLLRPYAGTEPDEFLADAFASRFLAAPLSIASEADRQQQSLCSPTLQARDPEAWNLAADMVTHLRR
jgi:hypothetical protein